MSLKLRQLRKNHPFFFLNTSSVWSFGFEVLVDETLFVLLGV